jgi:HSP20 family protein
MLALLFQSMRYVFFQELACGMLKYLANNDNHKRKEIAMWPNINRWEHRMNPFAELDRLQRQMNQLFDSTSGRYRVSDFPAINLEGNDEKVHVTAEVPGIDPANLDLSVTGNTLTIKGERADLDQQEGDVLYRQERPVGRFMRTIRLPYEVDNSGIEARYEHGVLHITLPRSESTKPRKIQIQC